MTDEITSFLNPKDVVVFGASRSKKKIGRIIFDQIKTSGRKITGVNKSLRKSVGDIYPSLFIKGQIPDLAIYAIPAEFVRDELENAAILGIKNHLIISAGFEEIGENGAAKEKEIIALKEKYHLNIQGPNCLGNISPVFNFNASFGYTPKSGNIGLILQSGAIGTAFLDWAEKRGFGISHFISIGNKADLSETEFLEILFQDSSTKVIGIYLESIKKPIEFIKLAEQVCKKKPIVVLSAGKTKTSKIAVTSHTGALAGNYVSEEAAFRQAGIIEAYSLEEFFVILELLSDNFKTESLSSALVLTNAGGPAVLVVDQFAKINLPLLKLHDSFKKKLKNFLPSSSSVNNPIDLLGDATPQRFSGVFKNISNNKDGLLILVILTPQENTDFKNIAKEIIAFKKKFHGYFIVNILGGSAIIESTSYLRKNNILVFNFLDNVINAVGKIINYYRWKSAPAEKPIHLINIKNAKYILLRQKLKKTNHFIQEELALLFSKEYHIPFPQTFFIDNLSDGLNIIKKISFPVVLKISSTEIIHRNKQGGVFSDIKSEEEFKNAFRVLQHLKGKIIIQKMVEHDIELIIGAKKDPEFGYLLMFGSGGIHTEYLKDISFAVTLLFNNKIFHDMISRTKMFHLLLNPMKLRSIFVSLVSLLHDFPEIEEIDLNPVVIDKSNNPICVDIKIKV